MRQLTESTRQALLQRARRAIATAIGAVASGESPAAEPGSTSVDDIEAGAFVTVRVSDQLRGCIGYLEATLPLSEVVERCAVSAATSDPRFPALTPEEWQRLSLEISVLGPVEPLEDIADVVIGQHGLIVERDRRRGLLLPQVAVEWRWDARQFASQTCVKAGLPANAWQNGAALYRFEAQVFADAPGSHRLAQTS